MNYVVCSSLGYYIFYESVIYYFLSNNKSQENNVCTSQYDVVSYMHEGSKLFWVPRVGIEIWTIVSYIFTKVTGDVQGSWMLKSHHMNVLEENEKQTSIIWAKMKI